MKHDQQNNSLYFITFTCYKWIHLFSITNAYDTVYKWFDYLHEKNIRVTAYVIMPNHLHLLLYFPEMKTSLNSIISNGKRFVAYEMVKRLSSGGNQKILEILRSGVSLREQKKAQKHRVFEESFEAKECYSVTFTYQKLDYIHINPIRGKWKLADDFTEYPHSSASYYTKGELMYPKLLHINEILK